MPLMFNMQDREDGGIGIAAALYMRHDFYVPRKFADRFPDAVAFVLVKSEGTLHPVYYNERYNLFLLDSKTDAHRNLIGLIWGGSMQSVFAYLTDEKRREELEPMVIGPYVSESLKARLPRRKVQ